MAAAAENQIDKSFYDVAIQQRNRAWKELEEMRFEVQRLESVKQSLDRAVNEWLVYTQWVQETDWDSKIGIKSLGMHRAKILNKYIEVLVNRIEELEDGRPKRT